jgi:hypothetical protein
MLLATVAIDLPIVAALGALFAVFMARSIAAGAPLRRSLLSGAFIGAWLGASFGMHAFKYPAWMLCYAVDPRALPTAVWYPVFVALLVGCGALGALYAHRFIAAGRKRAAVLLVLALAAIWAALFALTLRRYLLIGTYEDFWAGLALPLSAQPDVVQDFNVASIVTPIGPLLLLVFALLRQRAADLRAASNSSPGVQRGIEGASATRKPTASSS